MDTRMGPRPKSVCAGVRVATVLVCDEEVERCAVLQRRESFGLRKPIGANVDVELRECAKKELSQCFSTFFDSRHPFLAIEKFGGTPAYNSPVNRRKVQIFTAPPYFFRAPKGSAAPRLRTTKLSSKTET